MPHALSRRDLLKTAGVAALPASAASRARIRGANDRLNLGVVGCGNRGYYIMTEFQKFPNVRVTAVCDVFGEKAERAAHDAPGAVQLGDHRRLIERKDVDMVLVTTPDHWHAAVSIDAMNAGKDVYVEKPLMFRREEGPAIVRAAQRTQRICQVGLQQRSGELFLKAKREIFDTGLLGHVSMVRTVWHYGAPYDLGDAHEPKPATLDWARFLGQIPWREWSPHQYHNYRLYLDFGGACITDLFTHWIDVVHMLLGQDRPRSVTAGGGIFVARDDRTAPDTANVLAEYDGFNVTFESASLPGMPLEHAMFLGTEGKLWMSRQRYEYTAKEDGAKPVAFQPPDDMVPSHIGNFLDSVRSRREPNCPAHTGERAAQVCLMAREAYIQRRRILNDEETVFSSGS
jgi:predicted dehydrogenase